MQSNFSPRQNRLLSALPSAELHRLLPHLELISMSAGEIIYEPGKKLKYVYFPVSSIISFLYFLEDGASTETAIVGNEGMLGVSTFMGGDSTPYTSIVRNAGYAYRMHAQVLANEFNRAGPLLYLLLRYTQALITQLTQTAVCNRHHSIDQQLCRLLLQSFDRAPSSSLFMTQELIANMLGVRRGSVSESAGKLQRLGFISYVRGNIQVIDRHGIEQAVCECYAVINREFKRLLSDIPQGNPCRILGSSN